MAATSLAEVLQTNSFLTLTANNKIFCSITNHEMPPKVDIVLGHINGDKFKKIKEWYSYDYSEFEPYIVTDRQNSAKLHCKLTGQTLNKIPNQVRKHSSGKKFLRLKKENEELQKKEALKEKDTNPNIWVPPEELLEEEDDNVPDVVKGGKVTKEKMKTNRNANDAKEVEDDTFSDLLGSDHGDELDDENDEDDDFDELEEDSEDELDGIDSLDVSKVVSKALPASKIPAKVSKKVNFQKVPNNSEKNSKRKSVGETSLTSNKKIKPEISMKKGMIVTEGKRDQVVDTKKASKKLLGKR